MAGIISGRTCTKTRINPERIIPMYNVVEKFLRYVQFDTMSDEKSSSVPSTSGQMVLAKEIAKDLQKIGMQEVHVDANAYVMAVLPANIDKTVSTIGFIAHMDTSPDMTGKNVKPQIIENYDGKDIDLNSEITLKVKDFPELGDFVGQTLITTDGTTLLGADDKAGIAEIVSAMEYLVMHQEIPHGTIKIAFTPDEEVGRGADHFDLKRFNADFAYTIDGGALGELEFENFNAAKTTITIQGRNVHPGTAKNKMINAMLVAHEFITKLPENETPENTEGYEGFFHLTNMNGTVEKAKLDFIIRDFNADSFQKRKEVILKIVDDLQKKHDTRIKVQIDDQYFNMKEKIEPVSHIIDVATKAMQNVGIKPDIKPIRGGTDGARLSYMGLPTPNIFTGGYNFHGRFEFIPVESMQKAVQVIIEIIKLVASK